jgi:hypothetical protein
MIDQPAQFRFTGGDKASVDMRWGENEAHLLKLWQDDTPVQLTT